MAITEGRGRGGSAAPERASAGETGTAASQRGATRKAILDAALAEFARHGFGGARVSRIAEAAGVNKRMLYHYLGNKEALYLAALESVYETIRARELALDVERLEPRAAVRELVRTIWTHFLEHPEFIAMLANENLNRARYITRSAVIPKLQSPLIALIERLLARGTASGLFRADADPFQLYLSIAGLCYFYFSNHRTLSVIFDRDFMAEEALRARLDHVTEVVLSYLETHRRAVPPA